jgi:hypothetical protein
MAKNKTAETEINVSDFINAVPDETRRNDSFRLNALIESISGHTPKMWGPSIVGFGSYHYKYDSGHEGDAPLMGYSPRKDAISLYFSLEPQIREEMLARLGKHKSGKGCVYVKKLADIDQDVLVEMISATIDFLKKTYPEH